MRGLTKEQEILRQVRLAKSSHFGATAIKIEMEGVFFRSDRRLNSESCPKCHGEGYLTHEACAGRGGFGASYDYGLLVDGSSITPCLSCNMTGHQACSKCFDTNQRWTDITYCQQWLLKQMHEMGLSQRKRDGSYVPKKPLIFGMFYDDPSVDSEFTFTLSLKNEQNIFLLPRILALWKKMGFAIGNGLSIQNAGMHMALLGDKSCKYPSSDPADWRDCLINMDRSMRLLMPALFFLGSDNRLSRGMRFRIPRTSTEKYSAIHYTSNCLEFRVFEPCYDNPERVLDNFVVMRNCLRFWSRTYKTPSLTKIASTVNFGNDSGDNLDRLYTTACHLDLLNAGILKLKPKYKTVAELKRERSFKKTKKTFVSAINQWKAEARTRYPSYRNRQQWQAIVNKYNELGYYLERREVPSRLEDMTQAQAEVAEEAERVRERQVARIPDEERFVEEEVRKQLRRQGGQYTLAV